jgi:hypothetical protein
MPINEREINKHKGKPSELEGYNMEKQATTTLYLLPDRARTRETVAVK